MSGLQRGHRERGAGRLPEGPAGARPGGPHTSLTPSVTSSCLTTPTPQDYDSSDLADFAKTIMKGCDTNRDGKISKKVFDGAYDDCEDD